MKTTKTKEYRNNGAFGALLDEYEKSLDALIAVIKGISNNQLTAIVDDETNDEDCKSIQGILTHIVQSGYTYVVEIRRCLGEEIQYKEKVFYQNVEDYELALREMFTFNEALFTDYPNLTLCENDSAKKIKVRWGQEYDIEQLFEHAIVHILRHK